MDSLPFSPAAERNRGAILEVLERVLPASARVLEVASGTGQHAEHFAASHPTWMWQPTDVDRDAFEGIVRRVTRAGLSNVREPIVLDVREPHWDGLGEFDAMFAANMIHIAPFAACVGLMQGAAVHLREGGVLVLYGPYRIGGAHTAESNAQFDQSLRARNPEWGVRELESVVEAAERASLKFVERVAMPANNFCVVFAKPRSA